MFKLNRTFLCQFLLCSFLSLPVSAFALGSISVAPAGNASFNILADNLGAPCGIHVRVTYDSTRLSNPRVVQGNLLTSGAMFIANTNVAGEVQLAAISTTPFKSSGILATVSFDQIGDSAGTIGLAGVGTAPVIDGSHPVAKSIPVQFFAWSAGSGGSVTDTTASATSSGSGSSGSTGGSSTGTGGTPTGTGTTTTTGSGTTSGIPYMVGGTVTMPGDESAPRKEGAAPPAQTAPGQPQQQPENREAATSAPTASETNAPAESQPAARKAKVELPKSVPSVLEKFRTFSGERTPASLSALFDRDPAATFTQTPPVFIADGKNTVKVLFSKVPGDRAPNFTFSHAAYVSLSQGGEGEWLVEVKPEKGALKAAISMFVEGGQLEIPLAVAPQANVDLDKSGTVTEADFQIFLQNRGSEAAPLYDLNGDGKRDYQDDYIFTANYLVKRTLAKPESPAPKK